ncbi:hypothetical protein [Ramlibacter sp.]|uniref:hypothetical protein n=1 Tax=Ramlibacter sp. TaxID=1917967 RepID=UPI003D142355
MGQPGNPRTASLLVSAQAYVQKYLEIEGIRGPANAGPEEYAEMLVLSTWAEIPEISQGEKLRDPALLAAAAYAQGILYQDSVGNRPLADRLARCQSRLIQDTMQSFIRSDAQDALDKKLADLAHSIFER